jgi:N12 class adenine-specific DNA methylase
MRIYYIIIGMAVVLIVLLGGFAVLQDSQLTTEKARNAELQKKVESLEEQVSALKETADKYFQRGVDMQYAGNLQEAKAAFETVISKFPASNLAGSAKERLIFVNQAIAQKGAHVGPAQ